MSTLSDTDRQVIRDFKALIARETENDGDTLTIKGLGTFSRQQNAAKQGRNPQTGDTLTIPARSVLRFKASATTRRDI